MGGVKLSLPLTSAVMAMIPEDQRAEVQAWVERTAAIIEQEIERGCYEELQKRCADRATDRATYGCTAWEGQTDAEGYVTVTYPGPQVRRTIPGPRDTRE
jgi:hypothetical protein